MKKMIVVFLYLITVNKTFSQSSYILNYDKGDKNPSGQTFFSGGLAYEEKRGIFRGYIDKTGKIMIDLGTSVYGFPFFEEVACVQKNSKRGFIDKTGKLIIDYQFDEGYRFSEGLACVAKEGLVGFIDKLGETIIDFQFTQAGNFSEGLAPVKNKDRKWGFIDKTGKIIIDFQYDYVNRFTEGLAAVSKNNKWGFINKSGNVIIKFDDYKYVKPFSEGFAIVKKSYGVAFIDKTGKKMNPNPKNDQLQNEMNEYKYLEGYSFSEGLAGVVDRKDNKMGFIDKTGKIVIDAIFTNYPTSFSEGLANLSFKSDQNTFFVFVDNKDNFLKMKDENYFNFNPNKFFEGLARVGKSINGIMKWGYINKSGDLVIDYQFSDCIVY